MELPGVNRPSEAAAAKQAAIDAALPMEWKREIVGFIVFQRDQFVLRYMGRGDFTRAGFEKCLAWLKAPF